MQGAEKVIDLNMTAAKTSMEESVVGARQLLGSKDAQEAVGFVAALPQPTVTKMVAYFRHLTTIANEAQSEVTRATEEQFAEMGRQVLGVMEQAFRNAPAGSENALAAVRSAITTANAGLEQFNQNAKKAVDTVEASVNQAVDQAVQVAEQASTAAARARKQ
jgi:phasin family protein